ncbi:helix-turn-helix domain-containing protein [Kineococcus sp. SYSU DK003]|uniref:helix-turn-helix domain-containing protein n=1 Tax=Kineococcus sp. SYSU DK003 TaxID=3383124 RepID=UPI003D7D9501
MTEADDTGGQGLLTSDLGARLRSAREAHGVSLREMARRVEVSPSFMSQIELGRAQPSIGTLFTIVTELGLSLDELMSSTTSPAPESAAVTAITRQRAAGVPGLQHPDERPELYTRGVRWERLTPYEDRFVEFLRVTYEPGTESCPADDLMTHQGWEYAHVLGGRLNVQVAFERTTVAAGDSFNFDSTVPHRLSNPYDEDCVAVWFITGRSHDLPSHQATPSRTWAPGHH